MTDRASSRRRAARTAALVVLTKAFPGRTAALALLSALNGALPAVFAALVGVLVGQLPTVVHDGFGSPAGHRVIVALIVIGAVLVGQEIAGSAQGIVGTDLYRRFNGYLLGRVMATALRRHDLELFDDPEQAARLGRAIRAAQYGPGELVSGLSSQWTARARGLAAAVLVGYYWPVAAAVLTVMWLVAGRAVRSSAHRANPFWTDPLRRAAYFQHIGLLPHWAKELRIFGLVDWIVEQYSREWRTVMAELWRTRRADHRTMAALSTTVLAAHLVILILLARSDLSVAALTVVIQGLFAMAALSSQDGDVWIENGAIPIPDVLSLERSITPDAVAGRPADGLPERSISFHSVDFGYANNPAKVLSNFDLEIAAGTSLAVVGLNGAGKTTLVKLMTGLGQPQKGTIAIDGIDLNTLNLVSWRKQLAVIFQDFVRYELPLRDNIGFGAVEAEFDDSTLRAIAERAGAAALIDALPYGPGTTLSPRFTGGVDLSGGQWQRIAFARALTAVQAGARVLVMDEPTAHLDVRAEADLYDRFLELTRGLTTIV